MISSRKETIRKKEKKERGREIKIYKSKEEAKNYRSSGLVSFSVAFQPWKPRDKREKDWDRKRIFGEEGEGENPKSRFLQCLPRA